MSIRLTHFYYDIIYTIMEALLLIEVSIPQMPGLWWPEDRQHPPKKLMNYYVESKDKESPLKDIYNKVQNQFAWQHFIIKDIWISWT